MAFGSFNQANRALTAGKSEKIPGTIRNSWLLADCWGRSKADKEWAGPEESTAGFWQSIVSKGNQPNGLEWLGNRAAGCWQSACYKLRG